MALRGEFPFYLVLSRPNPAAGSGMSARIGGDGMGRLISLAFDLTTSGVAGNRGVRIELSDGTTRYFVAGSAFTQPANTTYRYGTVNGGSDGGDPTTVSHIPFPSEGIVVLAGHVAQVVVANIQAADQISNIGLLVQKFPNGPTSEWMVTPESLVVERRP